MEEANKKRKSTKGLHTLDSKQGTKWRNLKQYQALRGQRYVGGFHKGAAVRTGGKLASKALGRLSGPLAGLLTAVDIGQTVKEGVAAVRAKREHQELKAKTERKYGTPARAMATRHSKTIPGARTGGGTGKKKKPRSGNFKTIVATAGGKVYRRKD
jgi:hypothetical protein